MRVRKFDLRKLWPQYHPHHTLFELVVEGRVTLEEAMREAEGLGLGPLPHSPRGVLLEQVLRGYKTPTQAEQEAERLRLEPLRTPTDAQAANPLKAPFWTLPMALAWIMTRDLERVRWMMDEFRGIDMDWCPVSWLHSDGRTFSGFELRPHGRAGLVAVTSLENERGAADPLVVSWPEARDDLLRLLQEGELVATGLNEAASAQAQREEIPTHHWADLAIYESSGEIVVRNKKRGGIFPGFKEVFLQRTSVMALWQRKDPAVAALERSATPWEPPATLSLASLEKLPVGPRVPLSEVIDVLAFGDAVEPVDTPIEIQAADQVRAARAVFEAARDGRLRLSGVPDEVGASQQIEASQFDVPMRLVAAKRNMIERNFDRASIEEWQQFRSDPSRFRWREVHVDRKSLGEWIARLPAEGRRSAMVNKVIECTRWLEDLRRSGPQLKTKEEYQGEGHARFGVGPDQFRTAWKNAASNVPSSAWGKSGRPQRKTGRGKTERS